MGKEIGGNHFLGKIDDVTIYDRFLSPNDIAELYNSGNGKRADECSFTDYVYYNDMDCLYDNDVNRNGNHLTAYNGVSQTSSGDVNLGTCMEFDGVDDYASFNSSNILPDLPLTISFWAKRNGTSSGNILVSNYSNLSYNGYFCEFYDGNIRVFYGSNSSHYSYPSILYDYNQFVHIVSVITTEGMKVYLDGNLEIEDEVNLYNQTSPNDVIIGSTYDTGGIIQNYFAGSIDDLAIYNRALSPEEISNIYSSNFSSYITVEPISGTIPSNSSAIIDVTVDATNLIPGNLYEDILTIFTNDPDEPSTNVIINTEVLPPTISTNPTSFEINLNATNQTKEETFTITNTGQGLMEYSIEGEDTYQGQSIITEGLIAYYPFNGNANDESGNGNNGTVYEAIFTEDRYNNSNSACSFNGISQWIDTNVTENELLGDNPSEWSYSFWVKTDSSQWEVALSSNTASNFGLYFYVSENQWGTHLNNGLETFHNNVFERFETNWAFVTIVNSRLNQYSKIYLNNDLKSNIELSLSGDYSSANNILIGRQSAGSFWNGKIDDIRLYDRALTENEIGALYSNSILSFTPSSGTVSAVGRGSQLITMTANGTDIEDGTYETGAVIFFNNPNESPYTIPVTVNKDFTAPLQVQNLVFTSSTTDEIRLDWDANAISDSVVHYNVHRKREGESDDSYIVMGSPEINSYTDTNFTGLDDCNFIYKVSTIDWVDNEGTESDTCLAYLMRFLPPEIAHSYLINNNRDYEIAWHPVTETLSGSTGTPTCYVVYFNEAVIPESAFSFLSIVENDTIFVHHNVGLFQAQDKIFYRVTAYGGSLRSIASYFDKKGIIYDAAILQEQIEKLKLSASPIRKKK